ncbi:MAG: ATP-dependent zinc protease [Porticoccaceae bacterium]|nr:ATP-dependent zinc protease [Porticoccaceae bacterium]
MSHLSRYAVACLLVYVLGPAAAWAEDVRADKPIFGWLEKAIIMPVGVTVKVKLDSGALTSSMDARDIEIIQREGKRWVRFVLHLEDTETGEEIYQELEQPLKRIVRIRGAGGEDRRPAVELPVCIGGHVHIEEFTLRDRDNMLYPVLLGRKTISHLGLLDVTATYLNPPTCLALDRKSP